MVVAFKSLVPLNRILKLKLDLGILRLEVYRQFIHLLRGQGEVRPPGEEFMFLMLKVELASLEKLCNHLPCLQGTGLIAAVVQHLFVDVVGHEREGIRLRGGRDLSDELGSVLVLDAWLLHENRVWRKVEHTVVALIYTVRTLLPVLAGLMTHRSARSL